MNTEPETLWGLPIVLIPCEAAPVDEIIVCGHRTIRAEGKLIEEDGQWVARLTRIREVVE